MNTQITEDYVSFEVAKLLKEKGFDDEYTNAFYDKNGVLYFIDLLSDFSEHPDNDTDIAAFTLYMAMKWLREVHGLNVQPCIVRTIELKKAYNATIYNDVCEQLKAYFGRNIFDGFKSYDEACEVAIKYCLTNLI